MKNKALDAEAIGAAIKKEQLLEALSYQELYSEFQEAEEYDPPLFIFQRAGRSGTII